MKNILLGIATVAIVVSSFSSCLNKTAENPSADDTLRIDSVCYDTLLTYGKGNDAPICEIDIHFPYAAGKNAAEFNDSVANFLENASKEGTLDRTYFERMVRQGANEFFSLFRSDIDDAADDNPEYMRGAGYYLSVKYSTWNAPDSILVCEINESTYTGGAHGSYMESYLNVDKATGHVVSLSDICDPAHEKELTDAIVKQLMMDNNCTTLKQLQDEYSIFMLCDEPVVASQFYYDKEGITFVYNEYEIAPYAAGVIKATVPYATMKAFAPTKQIGK